MEVQAWRHQHLLPSDREKNGGALPPHGLRRWRLQFVNDQFTEASVRKYCGFAKHFFNAAVDGDLILKNPFAKPALASIERQAAGIHFPGNRHQSH